MFAKADRPAILQEHCSNVENSIKKEGALNFSDFPDVINLYHSSCFYSNVGGG
jgi:hypothetical protein